MPDQSPQKPDSRQILLYASTMLSDVAVTRHLTDSKGVPPVLKAITKRMNHTKKKRKKKRRPVISRATYMSEAIRKNAPRARFLARGEAQS